MQLYKRRDFGQLFSDTFTFLKKNGSHYFKNYFSIIALPALILGIVSYFFFRYYILIIDYSISYNSAGLFTESDSIIFFILLIIFTITAVLFGIYNYSYTAIYMMLYNEYKTDFGRKDIIANIKAKSGKIFIYALSLILVSLIILIPLSVITFVLAVTIVGILLIPILMSFVYLWYNTSFMEYISTTSGLMDSLRFGFRLIKENFWKSVGSLSLIYIILHLVTSIIIGIPFYGYMFSQTFINIDTSEPEDQFLSALIIFYIASMILQIFSSMIVQCNANIIYYSMIEKESNITAFDEIDQIGSNITPS